MAEQQLEQIEGTVEDIIYENTDNGYMVFEVSGGGVARWLIMQCVASALLLLIVRG